MTSDQVYIIIVSGAYLLHDLRKEAKIWFVGASWDGGVSPTILGHCDLVEFDLVSRIIVSRSYLVHYLR